MRLSVLILQLLSQLLNRQRVHFNISETRWNRLLRSKLHRRLADSRALSLILTLDACHFSTGLLLHRVLLLSNVLLHRHERKVAVLHVLTQALLGHAVVVGRVEQVTEISIGTALALGV